MEYPVCLGSRRVGTLYVCHGSRETELRAVCSGTARGLYRLYLRGAGGEVALGVTEDGALRRCFSRELLAPAGEIRCAELRPCGGGEPERRGFLVRLPPEARVVQQGNRMQVSLPWREGESFPLPELFCFARVAQGCVLYLFDGAGRPVMPKF